MTKKNNNHQKHHFLLQTLQQINETNAIKIVVRNQTVHNQNKQKQHQISLLMKDKKNKKLYVNMMDNVNN